MGLLSKIIQRVSRRRQQFMGVTSHMSSPNNHVNTIQSEIDIMYQHGHIIAPDEYVVLKDLEIQLHEVRKVFERYDV